VGAKLLCRWEYFMDFNILLFWSLTLPSNFSQVQTALLAVNQIANENNATVPGSNPVYPPSLDVLQLSYLFFYLFNL
jgi:hypothetical protein